MSLKKPSRRQIRLLCAEAGPGDGVDPRDEKPTGRAPRRPARKRRQLCRQVAETLAGALAAQSDDLLRDLEVVGVEPGPDRSRLVVTVRTVTAEIDPLAVLDRLARATGRLRSEVSASITRRRAPELDWRLALPTR